MKLYYAPAACSIAAHIAAIEAGIPLELDRVDLRRKTTADGGDFLKVNPKGSVPALVLDSGEILTETSVVLQYLAVQAEETALLPRTGIARWRTLELLNFIATELHKTFSPLFHEPAEEERKKIVEQLSRQFQLLSGMLGDKPFLLGEPFTIADAYAYPILNWTRILKVDIGGFPNLVAYLARMDERPSVKQARRQERLR